MATLLKSLTVCIDDLIIYWELDDGCHTPHLIYALHFALLYNTLHTT